MSKSKEFLKALRVTSTQNFLQPSPSINAVINMDMTHRDVVNVLSNKNLTLDDLFNKFREYLKKYKENGMPKGLQIVSARRSLTSDLVKKHQLTRLQAIACSVYASLEIEKSIV